MKNFAFYNAFDQHLPRKDLQSTRIQIGIYIIVPLLLAAEDFQVEAPYIDDIKLF